MPINDTIAIQRAASLAAWAEKEHLLITKAKLIKQCYKRWPEMLETDVLYIVSLCQHRLTSHPERVL